MVERLFLTVPRGCLQFVIVVFPDHTHLLFLLVLTLVVRSEQHVIYRLMECVGQGGPRSRGRN